MVAPMPGSPMMPMPGMQDPMGMQPPPPEPLPTVDYARLREMWENTAPPQPVYPKNFKMPKKPNAQKVHEIAVRRFDEMAEWRMAVRHDLQVLRGSVEGIFNDDAEDYYAGIIDEWSSPALIDEYNLAVSWLSGLQRRFLKKTASEELAYEARKVELAAKWLHEAESRANMLDIDSSILEPKIMLAYGLLPIRRTLNRFAEPWESPFRKDYIDPAQVVIKRGRYQDGIEQVYRMYSARAEDLAADYGDFAPSVRKKLEDMYGDLDDTTEFSDVVEYWDPWYRCVTVGGIEIVPVTEHRYGEVPYSFGFSPLGEPRVTVLPEVSGAAALSMETMRQNAPYKSVGFIRFMKKQHAQYEAIMKRNLYSLKMGNNPPITRYRSNAAAQMPSPDLIAKPGAQNEAIMGEEKLEPFPYPNRMQYDQSIIMDALMRDRQTGRAPLAAYGVFDQSNISGTATKMGLSAGAHLWKPWANELDRLTERDLGKAFRLWQRLGHTVEYAQPQRRPFVVPNDRPKKGEPGSFELTRECLAKVGPMILVKSDAVDLSEPVRWQAVKLATETGMTRRDAYEKILALDYDDHMAQEWLEEQLLAVAMQNPKFIEMVGVPTMFAAELNEAQGDDERTQLLQALLKGWMTVVVQPAMMEQQAQMGQLAAQTGQMQQAQNMNGPSSAQSFTETGQGPGSQTGQQGGPQGPTGPRGQGVG